ncbi:MAG: glycosyltransferase family 4 protein [Cloacibacterium sp.]|uniref:glycosyltransferase family 4 protein n=1 Tax=Cloacibacterium sp. TaxID=1913682 RepID=UPI003C78C37B
MKNKKIIIGITAEGSVNLLLGQLAFYKSKGYQTYLMAPYSERSAKFCIDEGCEHLIINIEREISISKDLKTLWQIFWIFNKVKPDIVNLGTPKVSFLGMICAFFLRVPKRIYTCRGFRFEHEIGVKRKVLIVMEKLTSLFAHKVICISRSLRDFAIKEKIFKKNKTLVIHNGSSNGIDLSLFNPNEEIYHKVKRELQQKFDFKNKFVFGFLGRIVDDKGINELFEVFCELYEENNQVRLFLVGPFEMSQVTNKNLINQINQHPGIINYGRVKQEEVPGFMLTMDIFVLPSHREGFGNVYIQAAAIGIPCIGYNIVGVKDSVSDGFNGILVPIKNKLKLKEAMIKLMKDKEMRSIYGAKGIEWAKNFNREIIWQELHKIYQS